MVDSVTALSFARHQIVLHVYSATCVRFSSCMGPNRARFTVMAETFMFVKCSKLAGLNFHNLSSLVFIYAVPLITSIVLSFGGLRWAIVTAFKLWHIYGLCWKWPLIVRKFPSFPTDKKYPTSIWIANHPISVPSLWMVHIVDAIIVSSRTHPGIRDAGNLNARAEFVYPYRAATPESESQRLDPPHFAYY